MRSSCQSDNSKPTNDQQDGPSRTGEGQLGAFLLGVHRGVLVSAVVPGLIGTGLSMEAAVKPAGATVS